METRQEREREFHNHIFDSGERHVTDKYYAVTKPSKGLYCKYLHDIPAGSSVLEYGCGPGSEAFGLAAKGCSVKGIDISDVAIEQAKGMAVSMGVSQNTSFLVMDAEHLEFPHASFDYVCGSGILHHLDLSKSLPEIARVLRPGGKAIFFEPLGHNPVINLYRTLTPSLRTVDEHPLVMEDFRLMKKHFTNMEIEFFHLTSIGTIIFRNSTMFERILKGFESFDQAFFRYLPVMKRFAWISVIQFGNS